MEKVSWWVSWFLSFSNRCDTISPPPEGWKAWLACAECEPGTLSRSERGSRRLRWLRNTHTRKKKLLSQFIDVKNSSRIYTVSTLLSNLHKRLKINKSLEGNISQVLCHESADVKSYPYKPTLCTTWTSWDFIPFLKRYAIALLALVTLSDGCYSFKEH